MSAAAPFSIAVTVTATVPFFFLVYSNGRTALSPTLSFVPGAVTSPSTGAALSPSPPAAAFSLLGSDVAGVDATGESCATGPLRRCRRPRARASC